jgi:hypothetical protein
MSKEELIECIEEGYWPDWEPAPNKRQVSEDVEMLYELNPHSLEYFQLKLRVLEYLAMNCIEQFHRGKRDQGILTMHMINGLRSDLRKMEVKNENN